MKVSAKNVVYHMNSNRKSNGKNQNMEDEGVLKRSFKVKSMKNYEQDTITILPRTN